MNNKYIGRHQIKGKNAKFSGTESYENVYLLRDDITQQFCVKDQIYYLALTQLKKSSNLAPIYLRELLKAFL